MNEALIDVTANADPILAPERVAEPRESMGSDPRPRRPADWSAFAVVVCAVVLALVLRVLPTMDAVYTPQGIGFQEPDAWYHMRTIHNLAAHFPWRSGFDPYSIYSSDTWVAGNLTGAPFWDYLVVAIAWVIGLGSPSQVLVDEVGAWLPAVIGALFPIPVFFLARRLFGGLAGKLSALLVGVIPGTFLWIGHLGMPDHHAIESLVSLGVLCLLCAAPSREETGMGHRGRYGYALLAGIALGIYLNIRSAGVFIPAILGVTAFWEPVLAESVLMALAVGGLFFLGLGSGYWSHYAGLSLLAAMALAVPSAAFHRIARRRHWSLGRLYLVAGIVALVTAGAVVVADAEGVRRFAAQVVQFLPWHSGTTMIDQVRELVPLWRSGSGGFSALFEQFGAVWIPAAVGLAGLVWTTRRKAQRPERTLFLVWSVAMILGVFFQLRMAAYTGVVVAVLAGAGLSWMVELIPVRVSWLRQVASLVLIAAAFASSIPAGVRQIAVSGAPDPDWWSALKWMRAHTPEPLGTPAAWYARFPAVPAGKLPSIPDSAYSVIVPWDKGAWVTAISHRMPAANGTVGTGDQTARFLTETEPEEARRIAAANHSRYAAIGPESITGTLPGLIFQAGHRLSDYSRVFYLPQVNGGEIPVRVYLPAFYESMVARLYVFGGSPQRSSGAQVFVTDPMPAASAPGEERLLSIHNFPSAAEARVWMLVHAELRATLGSADVTRSCVDTEELTWASRVFDSREERIVGTVQPRVVKIFALAQ